MLSFDGGLTGFGIVGELDRAREGRAVQRFCAGVAEHLFVELPGGASRGGLDDEGM